MRMCVKGIEIQAVIGTLHHERNSHQKILIDIEFEYDAKTASDSDRLEDAVDYSAIVEDIIRNAKESKCLLLETLAERTAGLLRKNPDIKSGKVTVKKPSAIKNIEFVSAEANFQNCN
ncbi:TPA: dihydroneopterin aldolase [Candidatus Delongbacteria bacterium]|nr:MAG: dihydroneopterin aldolase [Candidatus Delongbacteria bacterium GWF2_40_14]HAQ60453.1 dihydroneopterin aldolase [Candidatus Delongbacteria bacterium]